MASPERVRDQEPRYTPDRRLDLTADALMTPRHTLPCSLVVLLVLAPALARAQAQPKMPAAPADVARPPADAQTTASGLAFKVLEPGGGDVRPGPTDRVTINYTGWTTNGRAFDSTVAKGRPATLVVGKVMKGLTEGLQLMVVGEKRRFWIPEKLAYEGHRGRPAGTVVFDVELVDIERPPDQAPTDVSGPPADASKTASGLAYRVLRRGSGTERPTSRSRVTVHYTGWTTDGKMFDSSITRGQPATFVLGDVVKGWSEGVQLMVVGDKTRFWIPEELAYQGQAGAPQGMLVFDVELLAIEQ